MSKRSIIIGLAVLALIIGSLIILDLNSGVIRDMINRNQASGNKAELLIYVPPVLQPIVYNVSEIFEQKYRVKVNVQPGPIGQLITRIELTKEGDVLITPDHVFMLRAIEKDLVVEESIRSISFIVPALIIHKGSNVEIKDLEDLVHSRVNIRIPDPNISAYGRIALEILQRRNIHNAIRDRLIIGGDVSAVAVQVRTGAVDVAVLPYVVKYWYPSDVDIIWLRPEDIQESVSCQLVAVLKYSRHRELAERFIQALRDYLRENFNKTHVYAYDKDLLSRISPYSYSELPWPHVCGA